MKLATPKNHKKSYHLKIVASLLDSSPTVLMPCI